MVQVEARSVSPELDRKIALCAHTIMPPSKMLVVEDLRSDARFADNPLVTNVPHIRFYAGAAIVDHDDHALGTIAVIDTRPGTFSQAQRHALADLASLAMMALQSRRRALDLRRLAMTDYLTGIANRVKFEASINAEVHTARQSGIPFNVFLLDLDGFKNVNDTFGHATGDEVLRIVARRLSLLVRQSDTLARLGGDEFGIVVRNDHELPPDVLADRIRSVAEQPMGSPRAILCGFEFGRRRLDWIRCPRQTMYWRAPIESCTRPSGACPARRRCRDSIHSR